MDRAVIVILHMHVTHNAASRARAIYMCLFGLANKSYLSQVSGDSRERNDVARESGMCGEPDSKSIVCDVSPTREPASRKRRLSEERTSCGPDGGTSAEGRSLICCEHARVSQPSTFEIGSQPEFHTKCIDCPRVDATFERRSFRSSNSSATDSAVQMPNFLYTLHMRFSFDSAHHTASPESCLAFTNREPFVLEPARAIRVRAALWMSVVSSRNPRDRFGSSIRKYIFLHVGSYLASRKTVRP